jgi:hypothetical protein
MGRTVNLINPPERDLDRIAMQTRVNRGLGAPGQLGAQAFTAGNQVFFGPGGPQSDADRLLAHEVTHVVQQDMGRGGR